MKELFSRILLAWGALLVITSTLLFIQHTSSSRLSFSYSHDIAQNRSIEENLPVQFTLKKSNINLPVIPAHISQNSWETTDRGVSYLITSPLPGSTGNSIFYGHNWTSLLGNLTSAKKGDIITITFSDKTQKNFKVQYTTVVSPNETYILKNTEDTRLTIYTCTGFLDTKRFVVVSTEI